MNATASDAPLTGREDAPRLHVLIVEDDPLVRRLLRRRLHRAGLDVLCAANCEDAVRLAVDPAEPIQLVITDGIMPGGDGFEVARHFGRGEQPVPVILLSGYLNHFISRPDIPENIEAFFDKPFVPDEIAAKALDLLGVTA